MADQQPSTAIEYRNADDYSSRYANNTFFESSFWDLVVIFGQLNQKLGPNVVVQHTAISIPWPQVKVMSYFLRSHIAAYEAQNGHVPIAPGIIPPVPDKPPAEVEKEPWGQKVFEAVRGAYLSFLRENPEAAPPNPPKAKGNR